MREKQRTLFHVIRIHNEELRVRIPGWSSGLAVRITWENIAPETQKHIYVDGRYHGTAEIWRSASDYAELDIWINEDSSAQPVAETSV